VRIIELNHVALHVQDVSRSCAFYTEVLKLPPMPRPAFTFPGAWFRLGPAQELHLIGDRSQPVFSHHRGTHFALQVDDIAAWAEHFRQVKCNFMGPKPRPDGATQIFIEDPDGHVIELFTPRP
jgi:catechol 2,3-dioxygenase-like lactoylglutathione lyase family enzyme